MYGLLMASTVTRFWVRGYGSGVRVQSSTELRRLALNGVYTTITKYFRLQRCSTTHRESFAKALGVRASRLDLEVHLRLQHQTHAYKPTWLSPGAPNPKP